MTTRDAVEAIRERYAEGHPPHDDSEQYVYDIRALLEALDAADRLITWWEKSHSDLYTRLQGEIYTLTAERDRLKARAEQGFIGDVICSRDADGQVVTNVLHRIVRHSPDGFEWGYEGSGPADFALNILVAFVGEEKAKLLPYQKFKREFIATLPKEGGVIRREDIQNWIAAQQPA